MDEILSHYGETALLERIVSAISRAGLDLDNLNADDLAPVDEFHIGGRAATEHLIERTGLNSASNILDVGSGVGGTARYLSTIGVGSVAGVDITTEYVEVARALTDLVGLEQSVTFHEADVRDLPFPSATFDAAVLLHVGMNIPNKKAAFAEVARVLVGDGLFAIYDIMGQSDASFDFPVPWAASRGGSFLATADEYVDALTSTGFEVVHVANRSDYARQFFSELRRRSGPPPELGLHLLMGEEAPARYGNMVKAVESGAIAPVEIITSRHL